MRRRRPDETKYTQRDAVANSFFFFFGFGVEHMSTAFHHESKTRVQFSPRLAPSGRATLARRRARQGRRLLLLLLVPFRMPLTETKGAIRSRYL